MLSYHKIFVLHTHRKNLKNLFGPTYIGFFKSHTGIKKKDNVSKMNFVVYILHGVPLSHLKCPALKLFALCYCHFIKVTHLVILSQ